MQPLINYNLLDHVEHRIQETCPLTNANAFIASKVFLINVVETRRHNASINYCSVLILFYDAFFFLIRHFSFFYDL